MRRVAVIVVLLAGCTGRPTTPVSTDAAKTNRGDTEVKLPKDLDKMAPVTPVDCAELIALLPAPPDGYTAEKPTTETPDFATAHDTFQYNLVEQKFRRGDDVLTVRIVDTAKIKWFFSWIEKSRELNDADDEGHAKGLTLEGDPAVERYQKDERRGRLLVMVGGRYQIEIVATGVEPEFLHTVLQGIDRRALAALP